MFEGNMEGRVVVQAMVDSTGRVEPSTIEVVSATRPEFERPAVDMVLNSRFTPTPGRSGTRALRWQVSVPVVFDLNRGRAVGSADSAAAAALASEGASLARRGNITDAQTAYSAALGIDTRLNGSLQFWYALCWHGSLWGYAEDIMFACEQAVALEPLLANPREARGLARAMTSDYAGAIEDLGQSAARATTSEERAQRLSWIGTLRSGQNPFTEEVLRALRRRTT
jgi:TonB family protein